jgi:hypothetical protein
MAEVATRLTPDEKIKRARAGYEEAMRGNVERGLAEAFADDVVWHFLRTEVRGKQKVLQLMASSMPRGKGPSLEIEDVLAGEKYVAVLFGPHAGETRLIHVARVNDQGKISEGWASEIPTA